jgi:hypothetical protein
MPWFRAYVDKKGSGDHSRIIDGEAKDAEAYEQTLKLQKGEELNQIVELSFPDQADV